MSKRVIFCEGLGKQFRIGKREINKTLRDVLTDAMAAPIRALKNRFSANGFPGVPTETIWALKDVSFDIQHGEVVGIIGRNGAGKSTLLKILSRISEPSEGRIGIHGRVGSLLEVGTGFHPELTGRENIFLNGAILGMRRTEIIRKFDEIVEFAGVGKFLDTPVKFYSSGMYMRLAFAVAAHLDTEVLIVDEVLAVGDSEFQKKCIGKMGQVAKSGRTVLFVSHNISAVRTLCSKGILLDAGRVKSMGRILDVIDEYIKASKGEEEFSLEFDYKGDAPRFTKIQLEKQSYRSNEVVELNITLFSKRKENIGVELEIRDEQDFPVSYASTDPMLGELIVLPESTEICLNLKLGPLSFSTGTYRIYLWLIKPWKEVFHESLQPLTFTVIHSDPYNTGFDFKQSYGRGAIAMPIRVEFSSQPYCTVESSDKCYAKP